MGENRYETPIFRSDGGSVPRNGRGLNWTLSLTNFIANLRPRLALITDAGFTRYSHVAGVITCY
jgi:hypothetical protein